MKQESTNTVIHQLQILNLLAAGEDREETNTASLHLAIFSILFPIFMCTHPLYISVLSLDILATPPVSIEM